MSNSNENQDKSVYIKARVAEKLARDFRIALAVNDETAQDALARLIGEYVRSTALPHDLSVGKPQQ